MYFLQVLFLVAIIAFTSFGGGLQLLLTLKAEKANRTLTIASGIAIWSIWAFLGVFNTPEAQMDVLKLALPVSFVATVILGGYFPLCKANFSERSACRAC